MENGNLADGESIEMQGSGKKPYLLKNSGGVYSCSCPAWRNQSFAIENRTCKHLKKLRGDAAESSRIGKTVAPTKPETKEGPPILLAHKWDNEEDITGWLISEKLDGVRAYWDGEKFISRLGNEYHAPDWFKADMPKGVVMDGELFVARGEFQKCVSIVRRQDKSDDWKDVKFIVFDAPTVFLPFEERVRFIRNLESSCTPDYWTALSHTPCLGVEHLKEKLAEVEGQKGEGLMLRKPGSMYETGRSMTLLKVKTFHDAEAEVVAYTPGKGRHKGRVGALDVRSTEGVLFSVGTGLSDKERENPPKIGAVITYRFQELTKDGVPRFPSFLRERETNT